MEEIRPSHKAFWSVTKALKTEGIHLFPAQKTRRFYCPRRRGGSECLADSIETALTSHLRTTLLILVASRKRFFKTSLEP
ncbi:hypothetical protein EVAR_12236_1, partial [Eumeta japonica]